MSTFLKLWNINSINMLFCGKIVFCSYPLRSILNSFKKFFISKNIIFWKIVFCSHHQKHQHFKKNDFIFRSVGKIFFNFLEKIGFCVANCQTVVFKSIWYNCFLLISPKLSTFRGKSFFLDYFEKNILFGKNRFCSYLIRSIWKKYFIFKNS